MNRRELRERGVGAQQRAKYHHAKFEEALASLRRLAAQPQGGEVQAAGEHLACCELAEIQPAVQAFADALRQAAQDSDTAEQGAPLLTLGIAAIAELRDMAHHIERAADAHHELVTLHRLDSEVSR